MHLQFLTSRQEADYQPTGNYTNIILKLWVGIDFTLQINHLLCLHRSQYRRTVHCCRTVSKSSLILVNISNCGWRWMCWDCFVLSTFIWISFYLSNQTQNVWERKTLHQEQETINVTSQQIMCSSSDWQLVNNQLRTPSRRYIPSDKVRESLTLTWTQQLPLVTQNTCCAKSCSLFIQYMEQCRAVLGNNGAHSRLFPH